MKTGSRPSTLVARRFTLLALCGALVVVAILDGQTADGINNLSVSQRPNTGLVDIHYDLLQFNADQLTVMVEISTNGGASYNLLANNFTGDIGPVVPGTNKLIVWNLTADWPNQHSTNAFFRVTAHKVPTNMVLIPAGSFTMGDSFNEGYLDEFPTHSVYVSVLYMDRYEITKGMWDEVYQWAIANGYSFDNPGLGKAADHPVHTVNWYDMVKWCNARSDKEGRVPAYYTDADLTQLYKAGQTAPYVNWATGYRLPTEAEWEKAVRGGASGRRFPWTDADTITHSRANYNSSEFFAYDVSPTRGSNPSFLDGVYPFTSPVGSFAANGYGLCDMAGNVSESCWDWYGPYSSGAQTDPRGPPPGLSRVVRGGWWNGGAYLCRTAYRNSNGPGYGDSDLGFRAVLPPSQLQP